MRGIFKQTVTALTLAAMSASLFAVPVKAETTTADEMNALNAEIANRQSTLRELNSKLGTYSNTIKQKEAEANSLSNEMAILDNKVAKLQLDIQSTNLEVDNADDEIRVLDLQIIDETTAVERERTMLAAILRQMQQTNGVSSLELVFSHKNFSDLFDALSRLESVNSDLHSILTEAQQIQADLEAKKTSKEDHLAKLQDLQAQMVKQTGDLQDSMESKQQLLTSTQSSESEYRALVNELKAERSAVDSELFSLQKKFDRQISGSDKGGDTTLLSWPVSNFVLTTLFHDPSYPFRNLFEHSGLDLAIPQGTPVHAAAGGYVAFAKTGSMYGNYIMLVHGNGIATLYAHLSKMLVKADQYVDRGDVIGLSGGKPGVQGSGFSTGPHTHFEVRSDGIPVDPMGYMMSR